MLPLHHDEVETSSNDDNTEQIKENTEQNENSIFGIMFMSMMINQNCHPIDELTFHEEIVKMPEIDPKPEVKTVYRTWKINSDGTRTLMDEHEVIGA